jgi:hypothetical protein
MASKMMIAFGANHFLHEFSLPLLKCNCRLLLLLLLLLPLLLLLLPLFGSLRTTETAAGAAFGATAPDRDLCIIRQCITNFKNCPSLIFNYCFAIF